ncbi:MAG: phenylalanine--tRNA ligase subunit beta [Candidatus Saccharimonadales bacterium]
MKVSLNQVKQGIDFELPPTGELVARINAQLGGVEEVIDLADKYKDAKIVRVVECEKHPDADRLSVCNVDAGGEELVQVVCGAPNVHADMWAVWLPPESVVPATYDDAEPFVLGARKLRGVMSHGMLAAADELALGDDHEGIIELTEADLPAGDVSLQPGASFAKVFGLDDTIIDIENKMFTHRPDLFGQLGVAREIAGILRHTFTSPEWYRHVPEFGAGGGLELEVFNEAADKAPRFMAVVFKDVTVKPSPLWLQCALVAMGGKPINNIVDATNYVMLLTAQPTHAYDYDKLRGRKLGVRMAHDGETGELLNGKTYEFSSDDIVIVDGEGVVGLAGIMGGAGSEVSADTKNIVLEVANFDMYAVRKSAMRHGVFTDALTRFNKGQSRLQNDRIARLLMINVQEIAGGKQASQVFGASIPLDDNNSIVLDREFINARLGLQLSIEEVKTLLGNVEIDVSETEGSFDIKPPFWRTDLEMPEDIVEEVGRLYGFDKLPRDLPQRSTLPAAHNAEIVAKQRVREVLARAGGNEVLTYSFVHENVIAKAGQDAGQAFRLSNALSPDLQYYRLSVLPSLLDKVHMNIKAGHDEFVLYEIGKAHHNEVFGEDGLPTEFGRIASVYASKKQQQDTAYYQAKRTLEYLIESVLPGATLGYTRLDEFDVPDFKPFAQLLAPFDPVRTAVVTIDGKLAGVIGEFRASVVKAFKLPVQASGFELLVPSFVRTTTSTYTPLSRYPSVERDVCFQVADDCTYGAIHAAAVQHQALNATISIAPLDIYQDDQASKKNTTLRFTLTPYDKTLTADDVTTIMDALTQHVCRVIDATVV